MAKQELVRTTIPEADLAQAKKLDETAEQQRKELATVTNSPAMRMLVTAHAIRTLRDMVTPQLVEKYIKPLQGSALGFKTDKDAHGGYAVEELRDPIVQAMLMGLSPTGQEMCVITGACYAAKNGLLRKVTETDGLTDLVITPGVPQTCPSGALVAMTATWKINGQPARLDCQKRKMPDGEERDERIPVRVNASMGADAIVGKATRKLCKRILDILGNQSCQIADADPDEFQRPQNGHAVIDIQAQLTPGTEAPRQHGDEGNAKELFGEARNAC